MIGATRNERRTDVAERAAPVIDAHQHLWDPQTGWYDWLAREPDALQRRFVFDDARAAIKALLVANAYLEEEVARLAEAMSRGYARREVRRQDRSPR